MTVSFPNLTEHRICPKILFVIRLSFLPSRRIYQCLDPRKQKPRKLSNQDTEKGCRYGIHLLLTS